MAAAACVQAPPQNRTRLGNKHHRTHSTVTLLERFPFSLSTLPIKICFQMKVIFVFSFSGSKTEATKLQNKELLVPDAVGGQVFQIEIPGARADQVQKARLLPASAITKTR